jgi:hypothetical protein
MRSHSRAAEVLLTRCQEIVRRHSERLPRRADIVHFDFSPDNVLAVRPVDHGRDRRTALRDGIAL